MGPRQARGFSLTELMVGIVIMGVVLAASVPNLRSYRESQRMVSACDRIATACRAARARARSHNHSIIVEYRMDAGELAVIEDANDNGVVDGGEGVEVFALPAGISIASTTFTGDRLIFNGRGLAVDGGSITLTGQEHVTPMRVRVSAGTGQVRVLPGEG
jgi:prepilin-type N-terminal cleavage/methylation domain-containing protein